MKNVRNISLSSLAISVSATALLGVSGVAFSDPVPFGDPPQAYCLVGNTCAIYVITGQGASQEGEWFDGTCDFDPATPVAESVCGCEAWVATWVWEDDPFYGDPWWGAWVWYAGVRFQPRPECVVYP